MSFNFETFYLHNKLIWQNMFRSYQIQITCHSELLWEFALHPFKSKCVF